MAIQENLLISFYVDFIEAHGRIYKKECNSLAPN